MQHNTTLNTTAFVDALGVSHVPVADAARIACLVPSITELLFALGLGDQIVARTHYCIHPRAQLHTVASVGGTKKIQHQRLQALQPTHVIVNIDENTKSLADQLATYVPHIIVTHPIYPLDNLSLYRLLGGIFNRTDQAEHLCQQFKVGLEKLQSIQHRARRVLYLIWKKPWMTVSRETYIARSLGLIGWQTLPFDAEVRYPIVDIGTEQLEKIDYVLFSSEPYAFSAADMAEFATEYDFPEEKLMLIDGEMTSWYGNRAIQGLEYLYQLSITWNGA